MKVKAFITHKLSEKYSDCQDYFVIDKDSRAIAVSDGMSQSIFPGWWAEILTNKFVYTTNSENISDCMAELQGIWQQRVDEYIATSKESGKNPWRLENSIAERKGAGATLCGIRFDGNKWEGIVLGDTCLIEIGSNNQLIQLFPKQENGFGNHPDYFDSMRVGKGESVSVSGELSADKKLLIVSDPFGELIFKRWQEKSEDKIIERMFQVSSHEEFEHLVEDLRLNEKMHNDDSTMVCVEFDGDDNFNVGTKDNLADLIEKEKEAEVENIVEPDTVEVLEENEELATSETVSSCDDSASKLTKEEEEAKELQRLRQERDEIKNFLSEKEKQLNEQSKKNRVPKPKKKNNSNSCKKRQNILTDIFCFFRKLFKEV